MTYSVILFITRRPDYSPDEFRTYMEETHVPLVRKVMGDLYPLAYNRRYLERVGSGLADRPGFFAEANRKADPTTPVVLIGSPADVTWDMMGEMTFKDELHFQQCFARVNMEGDVMREDEEKFTLPEAMKVIMVGSMQSG